MGTSALCNNSYPHEAEWPGDNLETDLPPDVLGSLLEEISRPYTVSESRKEGSDAPNVSVFSLYGVFFAVIFTVKYTVA